jgi:hypothetical protein
MGSIALLVDGARLDFGEAAKHTESGKNVCVLSNYSRHENRHPRDAGNPVGERTRSGVYTLSDMTKVEHVIVPSDEW